jgi:hypothetical protein
VVDAIAIRAPTLLSAQPTPHCPTNEAATIIALLAKVVVETDEVAAVNAQERFDQMPGGA